MNLGMQDLFIFLGLVIFWLVLALCRKGGMAVLRTFHQCCCHCRNDWKHYLEFGDTMKYTGKIPGAPNFTYEEMIHSDTADRYNIDNTPKFDQIWVRLAELAVNVLQPLRDHFGEPIVVTSGYRCPAVNRAVGGSSTSYHAKGCAADIRFEKGSSHKDSDIFKWVYRNCEFAELIAEGIPSGWVHIAYLPERNSERATKMMLDKDGIVKRESFEKIMQVYGSYHC